MGLSFTIAAVFASAVIIRSESRGLMTIFYCLRFETPPTWRTRSLYLYPPGTGWPGYTPRHWVTELTNPTQLTLTSDLRLDYLYSPEAAHRKHIRFPAMDIWVPHRKRRFLYCIHSALYRNGSYLFVTCVFFVAYCCRLYLAKGCLPGISLRGNVFTESLSSNGSTCHNR
jgi:hypothetical protein